MTSLRRRCSCNTIVTNLEIQDTDFLDTHGCFSKQCTSEMSRTLQTSTVYVSRVSYLFECNANDTYVLRTTHMGFSQKQCTSEMRRTLQTSSTVYVSRVSYLFECNANDTYVLRMTHMCMCLVCKSAGVWLVRFCAHASLNVCQRSSSSSSSCSCVKLSHQMTTV